MNKRILLLSGLGVAAGFLYVLESNRRKLNGNAANGGSSEPATRPRTATGERGNATHREARAQPAIDDQGTDQFEASRILKSIRDIAFDASDEKLAVALGRPTEEIEHWTSGNGTIDGDMLMKARALAMHRGLETE